MSVMYLYAEKYRLKPDASAELELVMSTINTANGKVPRRPSLDRYDGAVYSSLVIQSAPAEMVSDYQSSLSLEKDAPRTHKRDKALLIKLGVDGDVPLAQARINAGLMFMGVDLSSAPDICCDQFGNILHANDNNEQAANAA